MQQRSEIKSPGIFTALTGLAAGLCNGLLGAGGGIIIIYALAKMLEEPHYDSYDIFANSLCIVIPMTLVSAFIYFRGGNIGSALIPYTIIPGVLGGLIGALLLGKIRTDILRKIFAFLVIYSGAAMIFR